MVCNFKKTSKPRAYVKCAFILKCCRVNYIGDMLAIKQLKFSLQLVANWEKSKQKDQTKPIFEQVILLFPFVILSKQDLVTSNNNNR